MTKYLCSLNQLILITEKIILIKIKENQNIVQPTSIIECHNDHRIAMSIAPLCMKVDSRFVD